MYIHGVYDTGKYIQYRAKLRSPEERRSPHALIHLEFENLHDGALRDGYDGGDVVDIVELFEITNAGLDDGPRRLSTRTFTQNTIGSILAVHATVEDTEENIVDANPLTQKAEPILRHHSQLHTQFTDSIVRQFIFK
jgi:hypothetical protein